MRNSLVGNLMLSVICALAFAEMASAETRTVDANTCVRIRCWTDDTTYHKPIVNSKNTQTYFPVFWEYPQKLEHLSYLLSEKTWTNLKNFCGDKGDNRYDVITYKNSAESRAAGLDPLTIVNEPLEIAKKCLRMADNPSLEEADYMKREGAKNPNFREGSEYSRGGKKPSFKGNYDADFCARLSCDGKTINTPEGSNEFFPVWRVGEDWVGSLGDRYAPNYYLSLDDYKEVNSKCHRLTDATDRYNVLKDDTYKNERGIASYVSRVPVKVSESMRAHCLDETNKLAANIAKRKAAEEKVETAKKLSARDQEIAQMKAKQAAEAESNRIAAEKMRKQQSDEQERTANKKYADEAERRADQIRARQLREEEEAEKAKNPKKTVIFVADCVRLYCGKDVNKKVKNDQGHGKFFPASYNEKTKIYSIPTSTYSDVLNNDCGGKTLFATNAKKAESIAPWAVVWPNPKANVTYVNDKCEELERKK